MKKLLFAEMSDAGDKTIMACLEHQELVVTATSSGREDGLVSTGETDFALIIYGENLAELKHVLNLNPFARRDLLETLAYRFGHQNGVDELEQFLIRQHILFHTYCYA